MGMTGSGYRGTIGPAANGKRILSGGVVAAQMPAAAMSLGADSGKMAVSYRHGVGKQNQKEAI